MHLPPAWGCNRGGAQHSTNQSSPARTCWTRVFQSLLFLFWDVIPLHHAVNGSQQTSTQMPCCALGCQPGPGAHCLANTAGCFLKQRHHCTTSFLSWRTRYPLQDVWPTTPGWTPLCSFMATFNGPLLFVTFQACGSLAPPRPQKRVPLWASLLFTLDPNPSGCPKVTPLEQSRN